MKGIGLPQLDPISQSCNVVHCYQNGCALVRGEHIAIGERSGELESMLYNVAAAYDDQVDAQVQTMASLLEPMMILVSSSGSCHRAFHQR